jgi:hypothetical protein
MSQDERMGAFDAVMWGIEDDPLLRSVIVAMVTTETVPNRQALAERVERLTRVVPKLRQCVIGNPVSLIPPRWVTDPDFDLDYHLRWIALPPGEQDLAGALRIAERAAEQDFDRDRPLWELTVATGLDGDGAAIVLKLHHAPSSISVTRHPTLARCRMHRSPVHHWIPCSASPTASTTRYESRVDSCRASRATELTSRAARLPTRSEPSRAQDPLPLRPPDSSRPRASRSAP